MMGSRQESEERQGGSWVAITAWPSEDRAGRFGRIEVVCHGGGGGLLTSSYSLGSGM